MSFNKRAAAEDAVKNTFTSLIVKGKKLNVVWTKKIESTGNTESSTKICMKMGEYNLMPAFDFNLKAIQGPKPPTQPPVENQNKGEQDKQLLSILMGKGKDDYKTMKANNLGGKKL